MSPQGSHADAEGTSFDRAGPARFVPPPAVLAAGGLVVVVTGTVFGDAVRHNVLLPPLLFVIAIAALIAVLVDALVRYVGRGTSSAGSVWHPTRWILFGAVAPLVLLSAVMVIGDAAATLATKCDRARPFDIIYEDEVVDATSTGVPGQARCTFRSGETRELYARMYPTSGYLVFSGAVVAGYVVVMVVSARRWRTVSSSR